MAKREDDDDDDFIEIIDDQSSLPPAKRMKFSEYENEKQCRPLSKMIEVISQ